MMNKARVAVVAAAICLTILFAGSGYPAQFASQKSVPQRLEELEKENAALRQQLADLKTKMDILTERVNMSCGGAGGGDFSMSRGPRSPASNGNVPDLKVVRVKPEMSSIPPQPKGKLIVEHSGDDSISLVEQNPTPTPLAGTNYVPLPDPELTMRPAMDNPVREETLTMDSVSSAPSPAGSSSSPSTPKDEPSAFAEIKSMKDSGVREELIPYLENYVRAFPRGAHAVAVTFWLGGEYFNAGSYDKAIKNFRLVTENHPESNEAPEALYQVGLALLEQGKTQKAAEALREVKVLYPFSEAAEKAEQKLKSCCQ